MKLHNKTLEIHRSDNRYDVSFILFSGNDKVPPKLRLSLKRNSTSLISRMKELLKPKERNHARYNFNRKDVDDIRDIIEEYEGLYDGWIDSRQEE